METRYERYVEWIILRKSSVYSSFLGNDKMAANKFVLLLHYNYNKGSRIISIHLLIGLSL